MDAKALQDMTVKRIDGFMPDVAPSDADENCLADVQRSCSQDVHLFPIWRTLTISPSSYSHGEGVLSKCLSKTEVHDINYMRLVLLHPEGAKCWESEVHSMT